MEAVANFFEQVFRALLVRRGIRCGAPMRSLSVCIRMYRSPRYLAVKPFEARPLWATVEVAAGSSLANRWVKAPTVQRTQSSLLSRKANEWLE